jgi:hypothetical protein
MGTYELGLIVYESDLPSEDSPLTCFTSYALAIEEGVTVAGSEHCGTDSATTEEIAWFDVSIGGSCGGVPKEELVVDGVWTIMTVWGIPEAGCGVSRRRGKR